MVVHEYRIVLPFTLGEYERGLRYVTARQAKETNTDSTNGEKVTLVSRREFSECPAAAADYGRVPQRQELCRKGVYFHKILYLGNRFPSWCRRLLPDQALYVKEEYWFAFPYTFCKYTSECWPAKMDFTIECMHYDNDTGDRDDVFSDASSNDSAEVIHLDIAEAAVASAGVAQGDPTKFRSAKAQRGPLVKKWWLFPDHTSIPRMCAYKRSSVHIHLPLAASLEKVIQDLTVRDLAVLAYRNQFCWMDEWIGMTMSQVADFEAKAGECGI